MKKTQKPPPSKKDLREGCFALIVILVVIVLVVFGVKSCFFGEPEKEKEEIFKPTKIDAYVHSQLCVEAYLKSPGSADFPYQDDEDIEQVNDSVFVIISYVDSQNTYGALVRTYYKTTVVFDKNGKAECKDLMLQEHK